MDRLCEAEKKAGRTHRRFKRMLKEFGPVEAASRLIAKRNTEGLLALQESGLLDISVEAIVLKPEDVRFSVEIRDGSPRPLSTVKRPGRPTWVA